MDKHQIVHCLTIANNLFAIEGGNPYSVRAHYESAKAIAASSLSLDEIRACPPGHIYGVGKETLAMIDALQTGGMDALLARLDITIPLSSAELLKLPGIGPKTAHTLVHQYQIQSAEALADAIQTRKLQRIPGLGTSRFERLKRDLETLLERKCALPIALAWPFAHALLEQVRNVACVERIELTGPLRRFQTTIQTIEFIAICDDESGLLNWLERQGYTPTTLHNSADTHHTRLSATYQHGSDTIHISIHVVPENVFPLKWMETTGDATHQDVMTGMLAQQGTTWTSEGLVNQEEQMLAIQSEKEIYEQIGLPYLPPEIREGAGILQSPRNLIELADIRGDLHVHSNWSDGSLSISEIAQIAERLGYEYVAITDHSQSLTIANGLTPERLRQQRVEIDHVQQHTHVHILHGTECDILANGTLDLPDDVLLSLDIVIASVHGAMHQSKGEMTDRMMRAIQHPAVHIIGHLSGRIIGKRAGYEIDTARLLHEAVSHGVMFELNANPNRLDVKEDTLRWLQEQSLFVPINTDAHHAQEFHYMELGVHMAKRGWLHTENVLNTLPYAKLREVLKKRSRA